MKRIAVDGLPQDPLAAAGAFHQHWLEQVEQALDGGEDALILVPPADHTHRQWRLAMVAGLARRYAPCRINMVAGDGGEAVDATETYLAAAPGITGQYLET